MPRTHSLFGPGLLASQYREITERALKLTAERQDRPGHMMTSREGQEAHHDRAALLMMLDEALSALSGLVFNQSLQAHAPQVHQARTFAESTLLAFGLEPGQAPADKLWNISPADAPEPRLPPGWRIKAHQSETRYIEITHESYGAVSIRSNDGPLTIIPRVSNEIAVYHGERGAPPEPEGESDG